MAVWEATGAELMRPLYHILLGEALRLAGQDAHACAALTVAGEIMDRTGEAFMRLHLEIARIETEHRLGALADGEAAGRLVELARRAAARGEGLSALKSAVAASAIDPRRMAETGELRAALARFEGQAPRPVLRRAATLAEAKGAAMP